MELARAKHEADKAKKLANKIKEAEKSAKAAIRQGKQHVEAEQFNDHRWEKRASLAGLSVSALKQRVRPMQVRRAEARRKVVMKRQARMSLALRLGVTIESIPW